MDLGGLVQREKKGFGVWFKREEGIWGLARFKREERIWGVWFKERRRDLGF